MQKPIKPILSRMKAAAKFMLEIIQDSPVNFWPKGANIKDHPKEWLRSNWHTFDLTPKLVICNFANINFFAGDVVSDSWSAMDYDIQVRLAEATKKAVEQFFRLQGEVGELKEAGFFEYLEGVALLEKTYLELVEVV